MKSNWIKYVFIIFIVAILIFAIFKIKGEEQVKQQELEYETSQQEKNTEITLGIARFGQYEPDFK